MNKNNTPLHMSSKQGGALDSFRDRMPPKPEDFIVLGGDVAALFTYSLLDHTITSLLLSETKITFTEPDALLVPVWSDVAATNFGGSLLSEVLHQQQMAHIGDVAATAAAIDLANTHYAPCLASFGVSAVLLVSCWLASGYFNEAFSYENTLTCEPQRAVVVASKTWLVTATMMVGLAYWSTNCFCPHHTDVIGLTKADTDFIFDTFSVLVMWRYMASVMLGGFFR